MLTYFSFALHGVSDNPELVSGKNILEFLANTCFGLFLSLKVWSIQLEHCILLLNKVLDFALVVLVEEHEFPVIFISLRVIYSKDSHVGVSRVRKSRQLKLEVPEVLGALFGFSLVNAVPIAHQ